jgi:hypothetical protein
MDGGPRRPCPLDGPPVLECPPSQRLCSRIADTEPALQSLLLLKFLVVLLRLLAAVIAWVVWAESEALARQRRHRMLAVDHGVLAASVEVALAEHFAEAVAEIRDLRVDGTVLFYVRRRQRSAAICTKVERVLDVDPNRLRRENEPSVGLHPKQRAIPSLLVERVQTGVRLEKRILKVLKGWRSCMTSPSGICWRASSFMPSRGRAHSVPRRCRRSPS